MNTTTDYYSFIKALEKELFLLLKITKFDILKYMENLSLNKTSTLTNVGNSILKYFKTTAFHDSFLPLDEILNKSNKSKVCLILFDGFGKAIIEKHKDLCPFIYSHIFTSFKSVYPPTTVAATTSLTTGKYPLETGYIGWTQHFSNYNDDIFVFLQSSKFSDKKYPELKSTLLKVNYIWELINENKEYKANCIQSFLVRGENEEEQLENYFKETDKLLKTNNFLYSYCTEPDHLMHMEGTDGENVKKMVSYLNKKLEQLVNNNLDTLFILVADHGMVDVKDYFILDHKDLLNSLSSQYITVEPRFASLYVKDETLLKKTYEKELKDFFVLKSKQELLDEHILGYGKPHELIDSFLGNYFLLAKKEYMLNDSSNEIVFKGHHAGISDNETNLYMMIFNN